MRPIVVHMARFNLLKPTLSQDESSKIVTQGAPYFIFRSRKDQIEQLSVSGCETYGVDLAVRKHHFQQFRLFYRILPNV